MKFILFVEGETEQQALPKFLKRWLDPKLTRPAGIQAVLMGGWAKYTQDIATKVQFHLDGKAGKDIIAAVGLLDLYGPAFYPVDKQSTTEKLAWAKAHFEQMVGHERFSQHFAVHEVEAWLIAHPKIFPRAVQDAIRGKSSRPEAINFDEPPAKLLDRLYRERLKRHGYNKLQDGLNLFAELDPETARAACPQLTGLLDYLLDRAKNAGL